MLPPPTANNHPPKQTQLPTQPTPNPNNMTCQKQVYSSNGTQQEPYSINDIHLQSRTTL